MSYEAVPSIQKTTKACAGASTAYVLRHVAANAGRFMIDVQRQFIDELGLQSHGATLETVQSWLSAKGPSLREYGLREAGVVRQLATRDLLRWIESGRGIRGAVVATKLAHLYPGTGVDGSHAVALTFSTQENTGDDGIILVDPWPGHTTEFSPPRTLDAARTPFDHAALLIEWVAGAPPCFR